MAETVGEEVDVVNAARRARQVHSEFLVITGLSGAGRTQAAHVLDDMGWFVIDNLPPVLVDKVAELATAPGTSIEQVALVTGAKDLHELTRGLDNLQSTVASLRVLFLEASDEVLVRRFEDTRRRHPFDDGTSGLAAAIAGERAALQPLKERADVVVDTTDLNVHQLRERIEALFATGPREAGLQTSVSSFGYKHGLPLDVDMVLDCRFLPNPHWVDELRPLTGTDPRVRDHVLGFPETTAFLARLEDLFELLLPAYVAEGKSYLSIAFGCTGGRHRSVVIAEAVGELLRKHGFSPRVTHRDSGR